LLPLNTAADHQYIQRESRQPKTEALLADRYIRLLYGPAREAAPVLFRALTAPFFSRLLAYLNYDAPLGSSATRALRAAYQLGIDVGECIAPQTALSSPRHLFERQIRYWSLRPMPAHPKAVVSPADSRMLLGSFFRNSALFLKEKFFTFSELLGADKGCWQRVFQNGDYAVFRLTPEKYHYNHCPVSGRVIDSYEIDGACHSCNPGAVVAAAGLYSKNRRSVTVVDTDVAGGTGVGKVAMIEVVALMIGEILQCYSAHRYDNPQPVLPGLFVERGQPKSLYRPGSSVDVLIFEKGRVTFSSDIIENLNRFDVCSRFTENFGRPLVETEVAVRSEIGKAAQSVTHRSERAENRTPGIVFEARNLTFTGG
jgi:phosphatidylserine decarboxylase